MKPFCCTATRFFEHKLSGGRSTDWPKKSRRGWRGLRKPFFSPIGTEDLVFDPQVLVLLDQPGVDVMGEQDEKGLEQHGRAPSRKVKAFLTLNAMMEPGKFYQKAGCEGDVEVKKKPPIKADFEFLAPGRGIPKARVRVSFGRPPTFHLAATVALRARDELKTEKNLFKRLLFS